MVDLVIHRFRGENAENYSCISEKITGDFI